MKTKLEIAHEYALVRLTCGNPKTLDEIIKLSWYYADAMQAEAEKRKPSGLPDALKEEWQPDWSQARECAKWWAMDADAECYWFKSKPEIMYATWLPFDDSEVDNAPSFGYTGNWQDSLRERPE